MTQSNQHGGQTDPLKPSLRSLSRDIHSPEPESASPCTESSSGEAPNPELRAKQIREQKLRWQSTAVLLIVLPVVAISVLQQSVSGVPFSFRQKAIGLGISAALALLVLALRATPPLAALTGACISACLYYQTTFRNTAWWQTAIIPLFAVFLLTYASTRFRRQSKERLGIAEARHGRTASQVAANLGASALVLICFGASLPGFGHLTTAAALTAMLAALAEAAADTVSSEIGQAFGGRPHIGGPWLITSFRRAAPGTDGAISTIGTHAGILAAGVVVLVAALTMQLPPRFALIAWASAIVGLFVDSYLGATLERGNYLNNDAVNFLSTLAAAFMAGLIVALQ